jgi:tol-pal system protein YbgF
VKGPALCLVLATGCASQLSTLRHDNRRLTQTVAELRADRRVQQRKVQDLQHQLDMLRAKLVTATIDAVPDLPVEVVAPPPQEAPADGSPRVVGITDSGEEIVYEGDAAAGKVATLDDDPPRPPARLPSRAARPAIRRAPPAAARAARPVARTREQPTTRDDVAASQYRAAVALVRGGQRDQAIAALRAFLASYPRHDYADNAQYWLAEAYYAGKDYPHALAEFRAVIETYPRGNKVPDALLKVGYCYQAMGDSAKARAVLEQVVNLYPKTEPAALAAKRLESP